MIEINHLVKNYGSKFAVDDVSFKVGEGEIVGFLGPNGAGKSTTMNILTGYLSSGDIRKLYAEAAAYVFPSKYEGFGSPQLECMENRLPLICGDIPTNREISGDYALFFSLNSRDELERRMRTVIRGEVDREKLNRVAEAVCGRFRWDCLAEEYASVYRELMKGSRDAK